MLEVMLYLHLLYVSIVFLKGGLIDSSVIATSYILAFGCISNIYFSSLSDQPNSLHSSQGPMTSQVNESLFAASPENQPVESGETSFTSGDDLDRKLQREYNYHVFGSRMDKAVPPVIYTPEKKEEERKRRVSYDPFAKSSPTPQQNELYPRAEKTGSNTNPYFWPHTAAAAPKWGNVNNFYGPNPNSLLTGNTEGPYGLHSAGTFSLTKPPVPESGQTLQSQSNVNWNAGMDTGEIPLLPTLRFLKTHLFSKHEVAKSVL